MKSLLNLWVNGRPREDAVAENALLVDYLRDTLGLTGTKQGCDGGECGACTVLVDGEPRLACSTLAHSVAGRRVETIEDASFGLFLLKLKKGAVMEFEQQKINGEVWLMDTFRLKFDARVALFKGLRREIETDWGKFRKFTAESRIVAGEP